MPFTRLASLVVLSVALLTGCDSGDAITAPVPIDIDDVLTSLATELDPNGVTPLAARLTLTTTQPVGLEVSVAGRDGGPDATHRFDGTADDWAVPVLGLYPDTENTVTATLFDAGGAEVGHTTFSVTTAPLDLNLPTLRVDVPAGSHSAAGFNLVSYMGHDSQPRPQRPFMFDAAGVIRWVFDPSGHPVLGQLFADNGIEPLANGNFYFGDIPTSTIYEIDRLGEIVNTWDMPGYEFHHDIIETPDNTFIVSVTKEGISTIEDHLIEIDRASGAIVTVWDLRESLDDGRRVWATDFADTSVDWIHVNGLAYDDSDGSVIVSGRTQGVFKITRDNRVVWTLAPHKGWSRAGDRTDLRTTLLQPLDAAGQPITDTNVLGGDSVHPDFEWSWYQHAPEIAPDGTIYVFDNGENRLYGAGALYSRAVGYRVDEAAMTVQQVFSYGKDRGSDTYSRIVSDVDVLDNTVLFLPGSIRRGAEREGKLIEVDRQTGGVVFEVTMTPPQAAFDFITFHRIERVPLYATPTPSGRVPA